MCTPLICIGISLTHVCMYVCMHVCTYVRMHVCISLSLCRVQQSEDGCFRMQGF